MLDTVTPLRMFQPIREVLDRRDLLYMITWREIKVKYKQTVMGLL
jgi:ABC-type polysaccharide/polyol phosphate export permease